MKAILLSGWPSYLVKKFIWYYRNMTNTKEASKYTGHLYNGGGIPLDTFAPVLEHDGGLILVAGSAGMGKTVLINRLVEYEREEGKQRDILSLDESTPIGGVDHVVFPTWHNQPKLQKKYANYSAWRKEEGLDTIGEMIETVMDHDPAIIVIDEIRNSEIATLAVALARHGYLVIAGIHGSSTDIGKENFERALSGSDTFAEFADGYEESSGYNDGIVDIVLKEIISIEWAGNRGEKMDRFLRNITIESFS